MNENANGGAQVSAINRLAKPRAWDDGSSEDAETERCPACGGENLHIAQVQVNQAGQVTAVRLGGSSVTAGNPNLRGSVVGVDVWCERCPATHTLYLAFRKGTLTRGSVRGRDRDTPESPAKELWRD